MRRFTAFLAAFAVGLLAVSASAGVVVGGTETFTASTGGADWGIGGPDGWQAMHLASGNNVNKEVFGSTAAIETPSGFDTYQWQVTKGQPEPVSIGAEPGTLAVQHMANWDGGNDFTLAGIQIHYITFNSSPGQLYELSAMVATTRILNPADGTWTVGSPYPASEWFGGHPRTVSGMATQFADIEIGLKNGVADVSDLTTAYTDVVGLKDSLVDVADPWVATPVVSAIGDGGPMTIFLKLAAPDVSSGAQSDLDVRWDNITLTPEPAGLVLLALGFACVIRRR